MQTFSRFLCRHKKGVVALYAVAAILSIVLFFMTPVNYNMMDYLPVEANSTQALDVMEAEFTQPLPNLNVLIEDVSLYEAIELKEKMEQADHVKEVLWLDDTLDLKIPLSVQDTDTVETYYRDRSALYMVAVEEGYERQAIAAVKQAVDCPCRISGSAADQAEAADMAVSEAIKSIIVLVPLMVLILILATESWTEPVFYLITLGVAVLINLGTNYFLGGISFVTLAAAPVLQIAVSLDYAVFLYHSFEGYKKQAYPLEEAMGLAMRDSLKSISASMLTTLFGFIALMFMQFRIGPDMGISLVKGVLLSFLAVMTFFPALLLLGNDLVERLHHRRFIPTFQGIGKGVAKLRIPVFAVLLLILIPAFLGQANNRYYYGNSETTIPGSDTAYIEDKFGANNSMVLLVPRGSSSAEIALCEELNALDVVTSVTSYVTAVSNKIPSSYLDAELVEQFYSDDYARIILALNCPFEGESSFATVEQIRAIADSYYPDACYTCGQSANMYDMMAFVQADSKRVNLITVLSIYLVLFLTTGNWFMPIFLILTIECSIWLNMCVPYFTGEALSYLGYLIVSTVQMGATVDYAILLTNTYLENRKTLAKRPAMSKTLGDIFSSILISSATLAVAGFSLMLTSSNAVVKVLGTLIGRGAILAVFMVMFLLPVFLLAIDGIIPHTNLPKFKKRKKRGTGKTQTEVLVNEQA